MSTGVVGAGEEGGQVVDRRCMGALNCICFSALLCSALLCSLEAAKRIRRACTCCAVQDARCWVLGTVQRVADLGVYVSEDRLTDGRLTRQVRTYVGNVGPIEQVPTCLGGVFRFSRPTFVVFETSPAPRLKRPPNSQPSYRLHFAHTCRLPTALLLPTADTLGL